MDYIIAIIAFLLCIGTLANFFNARAILIVVVAYFLLSLALSGGQISIIFLVVKSLLIYAWLMLLYQSQDSLFTSLILFFAGAFGIRILLNVVFASFF